MLKTIFYTLAAFCALSSGANANSSATPNWQTMIRQTPYWESKGAYANLVTIRQWVLQGSSFCENPERHILFDKRFRFLGYIDNGANSHETQALLNRKRETLAGEARAGNWLAGSSSSIGYPFALSCDQPHADLQQALSRYRGKDESARLWGTWDGMSIGNPDATVSLHQAMLQIFENRVAIGRFSFSSEILSTLAGKILIESGGRSRAHSADNARGIMQLSPAVLADCGLAKKFYYHRMAQVDCAFQLLEQNHRNLHPQFEATFGHLEEEKKQALYSMLLLQAYHGGAARVAALLNTEEHSEMKAAATESDTAALGNAAKYFAEHHTQYSAGDIALALIFHNLGRDKFGFDSLYYVIDVGIARHYACEALADLKGCSGSAD